MNLLLLTKEPYPNNRSLINELWLNEIPTQGVNVTWISELQNHSLRHQKEFNSYTNISFYLSPLVKKLFFGRFLSVIYKFFFTLNFSLRNNIDVIQVRNGVYEGLIGLLFCKLTGSKFSFHLSSMHAYDDDDLLPFYSTLSRNLRKFSNPLQVMIYDFLISKSDIFMPISESMGKKISLRNIIDSDKIFPVPISGSSRFLETINVSNDFKKKVIVYAGSLGLERDMDFTFDVFSLVKSQFPQAYFLIIGNSEKNSDIKKLKNKLQNSNINKSYKLILDLNYLDMPKYLKYCSIGICALPPIDKYIVSTPTKVLEYMSAGLSQVVNEEIIEARNLINSSKSGSCVKYEVEEFANKILEILSNKSKLALFSKNSKEYIKAERTYSELATKIISKYNN
tara:strand:- start:869 stop:2053 length:1185 start_codon:yes stop_codon:yes gene_type:complete